MSTSILRVTVVVVVGIYVDTFGQSSICIPQTSIPLTQSAVQDSALAALGFDTTPSTNGQVAAAIVPV